MAEYNVTVLIVDTALLFSRDVSLNWQIEE